MELSVYDVWDLMGDSRDCSLFLFGWRNWFGKHSSNLSNLVSYCLMWLVLNKRNSCTFEGHGEIS